MADFDDFGSDFRCCRGVYQQYLGETIDFGYRASQVVRYEADEVFLFFQQVFDGVYGLLDVTEEYPYFVGVLCGELGDVVCVDIFIE